MIIIIILFVKYALSCISLCFFFYQYNKNYEKMSLYMYGQLNITETVEFIDGIKLVLFSSYFSKLSASIIYSLLFTFWECMAFGVISNMNYLLYFRQ